MKVRTINLLFFFLLQCSLHLLFYQVNKPAKQKQKHLNEAKRLLMNMHSTSLNIIVAYSNNSNKNIVIRMTIHTFSDSFCCFFTFSILNL